MTARCSSRPHIGLRFARKTDVVEYEISNVWRPDRAVQLRSVNHPDAKRITVSFSSLRRDWIALG